MKKTWSTLSLFFQNVLSIMYLSVLDRDEKIQVLSLPILLSLAFFAAYAVTRSPWPLGASCLLALVPTVEKCVRAWADSKRIK